MNLQDTPILEWRWKGVTLPAGGDVRHGATDDEVLQVYVDWPRFPTAVRSRILGCVWGNVAPAGTLVKSQKTITVTYVVVRSGPPELGQWRTERRNVREVVHSGQTHHVPPRGWPACPSVAWRSRPWPSGALRCSSAPTGTRCWGASPPSFSPSSSSGFVRSRSKADRPPACAHERAAASSSRPAVHGRQASPGRRANDRACGVGEPPEARIPGAGPVREAQIMLRGARRCRETLSLQAARC